MTINQNKNKEYYLKELINICDENAILESFKYNISTSKFIDNWENGINETVKILKYYIVLKANDLSFQFYFNVYNDSIILNLYIFNLPFNDMEILNNLYKKYKTIISDARQTSIYKSNIFFNFKKIKYDDYLMFRDIMNDFLYI